MWAPGEVEELADSDRDTYGPPQHLLDSVTRDRTVALDSKIEHI